MEWQERMKVITGHLDGTSPPSPQSCSHPDLSLRLARPGYPGKAMCLSGGTASLFGSFWTENPTQTNSTEMHHNYWDIWLVLKVQPTRILTNTWLIYIYYHYSDDDDYYYC